MTTESAKNSAVENDSSTEDVATVTETAGDSVVEDITETAGDSTVEDITEAAEDSTVGGAVDAAKEVIRSAEEAVTDAKQAVTQTLETIGDAITATAVEKAGKSQEKTPLLLKVLGVVGLIQGVVEIITFIFVLFAIAFVVLNQVDLGDAYNFQPLTLALMIILACTEAAVAGCYIALGVNLLRNKRKPASIVARIAMILLIAQVIIEIMYSGMDYSLIIDFALVVILLVMQIYLDPTIIKERELDRKLRKLNEKAREEERLQHLEFYGKNAPYGLTFFNLFWTFVICSFIGVVIETIFCLCTGSGFMDRAGVLYGPFSPIYGFGAVFMTVGLNGIRDKNPLVIYLLSAIIGGAFEFGVSLFLEKAFGITAWDYSGTFLSIDGRTNGFYMAMWGLLGLSWVKLLMPAIFNLVYRIPWNWRYAVTGVAFILLIMDGALTLVSYDRWFERQNDITAETAVERFCDRHYPDAWMEERFQTMTMNAENATR